MRSSNSDLFAAVHESAFGPSVWTCMDRPRVRALQGENDESWSCASVSGPLMERLSSWPSWISARVRSHSRLGPEGHTGHLITNVLARPFSISSLRLADLSGKANSCFRDQLEPSAIPLVNLSVLISGCCLRKARFIAALLCQHGPSDPRQLVGESRGQNVRMQAHSGASEPDPEAVLRPVRRPQQNDPGCLHEEHAQVTVAALGDASEDGSVSGRHLLRDETEPSRTLALFTGSRCPRAIASGAPLIFRRGAADCGEYRQAAGSCGRSSARPATRMGTEDPIHGQAFHSKRPLHVLPAAAICAFWLTSACCQEAAKRPKLNSEVERCRRINNEHMRMHCLEQINSKAAPVPQQQPTASGTWQLARTPNPSGGRDSISITKIATPTPSEQDVAGLMLRCAE